MNALGVYGVEGLAGLGGRLFLGVKRVLVAGLLIQALAIDTYAATHRTDEIHLLANPALGRFRILSLRTSVPSHPHTYISS